MPLFNKLASGSAALLLATALAACGNDTSRGADPDNPTKISVTVTAPSEMFGVPWLVAQDRGFFEDHGVIVDQIVAGKAGTQTLRTQLAGKIPIGEVSLGAILDSAAAGAPMKVVGGAFQSPFGLEFYKLADNDAVTDLASVKRWGYSTSGSTTQAMTYLIPELLGIKPDFERVETGGIGEGVALLEAGKVDITAVPRSLLLTKSNDFSRVVDTGKSMKLFQQTVLTTTPDYLKKNPTVVKAVLAGYGDAVKWIAANPEATAELYAKANNLPVEPSIALIEEAIRADVWNIGFHSEALENARRAFEVTGYNDSEFDYCNTFDLSLLPENADKDLPYDCEVK